MADGFSRHVGYKTENIKILIMAQPLRAALIASIKTEYVYLLAES